MNTTIRMATTLADQAVEDLRRHHPFAGERVGFFHARTVSAGDEGWMLLPFQYVPIPDSEYIRDRWVGARIGAGAIRAQMEAALSGGLAVIHVHLHDFPNGAGFSETDREGNAALFRSLQNAAPDSPHGAMVLTPDSAYAEVVMPGVSDPQPVSRIVLVGRPMQFMNAEGGWRA